jgi:hypothetical protein
LGFGFFVALSRCFFRACILSPCNQNHFQSYDHEFCHWFIIKEKGQQQLWRTTWGW